MHADAHSGTLADRCSQTPSGMCFAHSNHTPVDVGWELYTIKKCIQSVHAYSVIITRQCSAADLLQCAFKPLAAELAHKLALVAQVKCKEVIDAYNECCTGRSFSMVWACKAAYKVSNDCIQK